MRCLSYVLVPLMLLAFQATAEPEPIPDGNDFGAGLTLSTATPLALVLGEPDRFAGKPVLVRGRIADVCQKKGCWTILRDGDAHVRVRFQDYGFFLPKDSTGSEAWAEGLVSVITLSESEARHYEAESSDGDPSGIDGPQRQLSFMASGVRIVDRSQ